MKIGVIAYSHIISLVIEKYINDNKASFLKEENRYVLSKPFKINNMHAYISDTIASIISTMQPDSVFIVGECYHYSNWRVPLEYSQIKNGCKTLLDNKTPIKYILKERDIKIDELMLNHIADTYFNKIFKKPSDKIKAIKHRNLSEDDIIYVFNKMFSSNILNIIKSEHTSLVKTNDLIFITKSDQISEKYISKISTMIDGQITNSL